VGILDVIVEQDALAQRGVVDVQKSATVMSQVAVRLLLKLPLTKTNPNHHPKKTVAVVNFF
jgi:hypothetical protein